MDISNLNIELERIDTYIESQREIMRRGEKLSRLKKNQDFVDVIQDYYLNDVATKLFAILTNPSSGAEFTDEEIHRKLDAIKHLKEHIGTPDYKGTIEIDSDNAPQAIAREEDYRKAVTAENGDS